MAPDDLAHVRALASRQHDAVHLTQLAELGITRRAADHMVTSGRWQKPFRATYVVTTGPMSGRTRASAALLVAGPESALARRSTRALFGLLPWSGPIHVVRESAWRHDPPGLVVHRTRDLPPEDVMVLDRLRTTTPLRMLLDSADDLGTVDLADLLATTLTKGLVRERELLSLLARTPRDPFTRQLRLFMDVDGTALSGVELVLLERLKTGGMSVKGNVTRRMRKGHQRKADIMVMDAPLIVQIDTKRWHPASANAEDMVRDREWFEVGFVTLRIPGWRIRADLEGVVREVVEAARDARRLLSA